MSDLTSLRERVEKATGADREIDALILKAMGHGVVFRFGDYDWRKDNVGMWSTAPRVTSSLDAALTLIASACPGASPAVGQNVHHGYWHARLSKVGDEEGPFTVGEADAPTPALALLSALLAALSEQRP